MQKFLFTLESGGRNKFYEFDDDKKLQMKGTVSDVDYQRKSKISGCKKGPEVVKSFFPKTDVHYTISGAYRASYVVRSHQELRSEGFLSEKKFDTSQPYY